MWQRSVSVNVTIRTLVRTKQAPEFVWKQAETHLFRGLNEI